MAPVEKPGIEKFLTQAALFAVRASGRGEGGPFGALIVHKDGRVLALTANSVLKHKDPTRHAEINAIQKACKILRSPFLQDCDVYSTTEPCPMCFSALHWARAHSVTYATTIGDVQKLGFNELSISNERMKAWGKSPLKIKRVRNRECENLLKTWSANAARQTY
jgi:tRNA(Arg) A34 adenosine deaminase TadA